MEFGELENIIGLCKERDRRAEYRLYRYLYSPLMSICLRYHQNKDDAAALFNDAFLKILQNLSEYENTAHFMSWCRRIQVNCVFGEFRKSKKMRYNEIHTDFSEVQETPMNQDYQEHPDVDAEKILLALHRLPEATRNVFNLFALEGFSHQEISEKLEISEGTSKWHVSKAREQLRKYLKDAMKIVKTMVL